MEQVQNIISNLQEALKDADKFDNGNAAAGTRVREAALLAKKDLDIIRKYVQAEKAARKG